MKLQIPSKTFLVGEYGAINSGDAILLATSPQFCGSWQSEQKRGLGAHPLSPAAKLFHKYSELRTTDFFFSDPWNGAGGFGASSAQFLTVEFIRQTQFLKQPFSARLAQQSFLKLFVDGPQKPSGYDVLAQAVGGVCVVEQTEARAATWPFEELAFVVFPTGQKLQTHFHLGELKGENFATAKMIAHHAVVNFKSNNEVEFIKDIREFRRWLLENSLEASHTTEHLNRLLDLPYVRAAKGCGALGSDAIVVLFQRVRKNDLLNHLAAHGINTVMTDEDLRPGLQWEKV